MIDLESESYDAYFNFSKIILDKIAVGKATPLCVYWLITIYNCICLCYTYHSIRLHL